MSRDEFHKKLKQYKVFGLGYFYPLISEFSMYKGLDSATPSNLPTSKKMADKVICLPIYPNLGFENILNICELLKTKI